MLATITDSFSDLAHAMLEAVKNGHFKITAVVVGLLIAAVTALRKYGSNRFPVLKTDLGAVCLTFAVGVLGGIFTAVTASGATAAFSWAMLLAAMRVNFYAMGGFSVLKKFALPLLDKLGVGWLVGWLVGNPSPAKDAAQAKTAGDAAVSANPAKGAAGVVGTPKDIT